MGTKLPVPVTTPPFPGIWAWEASGGIDPDFTMIWGGDGTGVPVFLCCSFGGKLEVVGDDPTAGYPVPPDVGYPGPGQDGGLLLEGTNCGKGIFPGGLLLLL